MIVAALAASDRAAQGALNAVVRAIGRGTLSSTVSSGVALGCIDGCGVPTPAFRGTHAYVGEIRGEHPRPGTPLRGDFAWVGRRDGHLRLARGRFGGRPLFWMRAGDATIACSRLEPLAAAARMDLVLDVEHLLAVFDGTAAFYAGRLPFAGAFKIAPNTVVDLDPDGGASVYEGPVSTGLELRASVPELAQALRAEVDAAVERCTSGAKRVAVFTGGGIDSSRLLAAAVSLARGRGDRDPIPLALDYGGEGDDRPHLRTLCSHLRVDPVRVLAEECAPYAGRERIVDATVHLTTPGSIVLAALERARAAAVDHVVAGDGSEYGLDAAPAVFGDYLLEAPVDALQFLRRFKPIFETRARAVRRLMLGPLFRHFAPPALLERRVHVQEARTRRAKLAARPWAGPRLREFLKDRAILPRPPSILSQAERVRALASSPWASLVREGYSRWEILGGLPISLPYLDDDFAQFIARLPSSAMFVGEHERGLLRESMDGLVPDSLRYRNDKARPYEVYVDQFRAMGGYSAVEDLASMAELEALGVVDAKCFRKEFERFVGSPEADFEVWSTLWPAIAAESYVRWFKAFKAASHTVDPAALRGTR
jgi:asparagine synthase (glutamine-hydrolysing)